MMNNHLGGMGNGGMQMGGMGNGPGGMGMGGAIGGAGFGQQPNAMQNALQGNASPMYAAVMNDLRKQQLPPGWQSTFDLRERATKIMQLITQLRVISADLPKSKSIAENFEQRVLLESANKEIYNRHIQDKLIAITKRREQSVHEMGPGAMRPANGMQDMNNMNNNPAMMASMNMLNAQNLNMLANGNANFAGANNPMLQNLNMLQQRNAANLLNNNNNNNNLNFGNANMPMGMDMGGMNGGMTPAQQLQLQQQQAGMQANLLQQNGIFPNQLSRPMQATNLAQAQANGAMDPAALQRAMQTPQNNSALPQSNPAQNPQMGQARPGAAPIRMPQSIPPEVTQRAQQTFDSLSEEAKTMHRNKVLSSMTPEQRAQSGPIDPLLRMLTMKFMKEHMVRNGMNVPGANNGPGNNNANNNNAAMMNNVQAAMANAQAARNNAQRPGSQPGGNNVDFSALMGQQANALRVQESGEQVVPASNNPAATQFGNAAQNMMQRQMPGGMAGMQNMQMDASQQQQTPAQQNQTPQQLQQQQIRQKALERYQQAQQHQQQMLAQQQKNNQQQQPLLQGQVGGVTAFNQNNGTQLHSPAMNMLNRPLVPPGGQNTPNTPLQNRPQPVPPTPANHADQLAQHHQNMLNQNGNTQPASQPPQNPAHSIPLTPEQQAFVANAMRHLPDAMREKIKNFTPQQLLQLLSRLPRPVENGGPRAPQNPLANPMLNLNNAGGANVNPQQALMQNNMPMAANNAGKPGMLPNGQALPGNPPDPQQIQRMRMQQMQARAMDQRPLPPRNILAQMQLNVPPNMTLWGELKQWVQRNVQSYPPNSLEKIAQVQSRWIQNNPAEKEAVTNTMKQILQRNPSAGNVNAAANLPAGTVPPSLMTSRPDPGAANAAPDMPQPNPAVQTANIPGGNMPMQISPEQIQVSPAEVLNLRAKVPSAATWNDEKCRAFLINSKQQRLRAVQQQMQSHMNLQNGQQQTQQTQQQNGNNPSQVNPANAAVNAAAMAQARQAQQFAQVQAQQNTLQAMAAKLGRPSTEDAHDSTAMMNVRASVAQQAGAGRGQGGPPAQFNLQQPPQSQRMFNPLPAEILAKLNPMQRQQYEEGMRRQRENLAKKAGNEISNTSSTMPAATTGPPQPTAMANRSILAGRIDIKAVWSDIVKSYVKGPPLLMDAATLEKVKAILRKILAPASQLDRTYATALNTPGFPEALLRAAMQAKAEVQSLVNTNGEINGHCSVSFNRMRQIEQILTHYLREIKNASNFMKTSQATAGGINAAVNGRATAMPTASTAAIANVAATTSTAPTNAKPQAAAPQPAHIRKASNVNKVPAAPTDNKTFDWSTAGQGVPKYDGRNELTPDKLKFPAAKKRKTDSTASTPAGQVGTPGGVTVSPAIASGKMPSPEQTRKASQSAAHRAQMEKEAEQKKWRCNDPILDTCLEAFENEEKLRQHQSIDHAPIDDPLAYMLGEAARAYGLDADGNAPPTEVKVEVKPDVAAKSSTKTGKPVPPPSTTPSSGPTFGQAVARKYGFDLTTPSTFAAMPPPTSAISQPDSLAVPDYFEFNGLNPAMSRHIEDIFAICAAEHREWRRTQSEDAPKPNNTLYRTTADSNLDTPSTDGLVGLTPDASSASSGDTPALSRSSSSAGAGTGVGSGSSAGAKESRLAVLRELHDWDPFGDGFVVVPRELDEAMTMLEERGDGQGKTLADAEAGDVVMGGAEEVKDDGDAEDEESRGRRKAVDAVEGQRKRERSPGFETEDAPDLNWESWFEVDAF